MLKKLTQIALLSILFTSNLLAKGLIIACPLTEKTDDHLYRNFMQNCGAHVEDFNPDSFEIVFSSIHTVDPQDMLLMTRVVEKWTQDHKTAFLGLSLDLSNATLQKDELYVTTPFIENQLYTLRDDLQKSIRSTSFPSGKSYELDANSFDYHLFSIKLTDSRKVKTHQTLRALSTLQDRIKQSQIIYHDGYMKVELEQPKVKITN